MTGDQTDMLARLKAVMPGRWFPDAPDGQPTNSPVLDGILSGCASVWVWTYALLQWVVAQTRISTASGVFLDIIARDYFGTFLRRRLNEADGQFRSRISKELLREKGTRAGMIAALTDLTGRAPTIFEPANTGDTGGYNSGSMGYGVAGGYGTLELPFQYFVKARRQQGGGIASCGGYGDAALQPILDYAGRPVAGVTTYASFGLAVPGGYGVGALQYGSLSMVTAIVSDTDILAEINDVKPVATVAWVAIANTFAAPSAPGAITGLTAS